MENIDDAFAFSVCIINDTESIKTRLGFYICKGLGNI